MSRRNFLLLLAAMGLTTTQPPSAEAEVPDVEPAVAEVPEWGKTVFEKNGCKVMVREEGAFTRFRVFDAKGGLIHEAVTKSNQFKRSLKEGEIGEFTLQREEFDLDHREVIHEDGTLTTNIVRRNGDGKENVIRQVVETLTETTKTIIPYHDGKPTELVVKQVFDAKGKKMAFHFRDKNGTVLFVREDMDIEKSQRRKIDGGRVPGGRVTSMKLPNGEILEIRGKGGYVITYSDFKLGSQSNRELYIAYDDGPIAYTFFHPKNPDLPHIVIMRNGDVRELTYDKDGKVTGWEKVPKPIESTKE